MQDLGLVDQRQYRHTVKSVKDVEVSMEGAQLLQHRSERESS